MQNQKSAVTSAAYQKHRKQVIWQIILPMVAAGMIFIALGIFAVISPSPVSARTGHWAAISTIWLVSPLLVAGLLFLSVTVALIYLMSRFLKVLPVHLHLAQVYAQIASLWVLNLCNRISAPFIKIKGWKAGALALRSKLTNR